MLVHTFFYTLLLFRETFGIKHYFLRFFNYYFNYFLSLNNKCFFQFITNTLLLKEKTKTCRCTFALYLMKFCNETVNNS